MQKKVNRPHVFNMSRWLDCWWGDNMDEDHEIFPGYCISNHMTMKDISKTSLQMKKSCNRWRHTCLVRRWGGYESKQPWWWFCIPAVKLVGGTSSGREMEAWAPGGRGDYFVTPMEHREVWFLGEGDLHWYAGVGSSTVAWRTSHNSWHVMEIHGDSIAQASEREKGVGSMWDPKSFLRFNDEVIEQL
jgi:hypothetical protein